jgi:TatD DNase family protein
MDIPIECHLTRSSAQPAPDITPDDPRPLTDLVDTHCHLASEAFEPDRGDVVLRAREAGVSACVVVGVDAASSAAGLRLADSLPGWAFATAGIHPTEQDVQDPARWPPLRELLDTRRFVAVGETGLDDFHRDTSMEAQIASLHRHVEAALELDLPVVLHCRDAFPRLLAELQAWRGRGLRGVLHCFTGGPAEAEALLDLGLHLGLGGATTYKANASLREAVRHAPAERLVLETDAPWLAPQAVRGRRNEPAFVAHVAALLAQDRGADLQAFAAATSAAARALFRLPG